MAPGEHAPNETVTRRATLWLSLRLGADNWLFEIEPDEERAIVVGSLLRAHVRIDRHDIAPVHFHFEREQDRIRVCPAYGADLCVNGTRICGPHELEAHSTIAFAGLELEAYVCDSEPNILEQLDLRDWTAKERPDCGAVLSLPDGAEVTRAIPRLSVAPETAAGEAKKYVPLCDSYLQQATPENPRSAEKLERNESTASHACESILPSSVVSVGITPLQGPSSEPTLPGVRTGASAGAPDTGTSDPGLSLDDFPSTAPVSSDSTDDVDGAIEPPSSLFTRIGFAARDRPVRTTFVACASAALLALAMLAASNLVTPYMRPTPELARQPSLAQLAAQAIPPPASRESASDATPDGSGPAITFAEPAASASSQPPPKRQRSSSVSKGLKSAAAATQEAGTAPPVADPRITSGL